MENLSQYETLIAIAIGVFLCLFGYRIKRAAFVIILFLLGYWLTGQALHAVAPDFEYSQLVSIGVGVVCSALGFRIEKLCIFAVAAYAVSTTIIETFQFTEILPIALAIGAGVIVGCIAVSFIKPFGIITTAVSGAKLIAKYGILQFSLEHNPYFIVILCVAGAIGILFQFKNCRHIE
jgi:hypothetical protein